MDDGQLSVPLAHPPEPSGHAARHDLTADNNALPSRAEALPFTNSTIFAIVDIVQVSPRNLGCFDEKEFVRRRAKRTSFNIES